MIWSLFPVLVERYHPLQLFLSKVNLKPKHVELQLVESQGKILL